MEHGHDDDVRHMLAATHDVAEGVIRPVASALDDGLWSDEVWSTLRDLDVFGMSTAERLGGLGLPYSSYLWVTAELSRASAVAGLLPALNVLVARALEQSGSDEAIGHYLPGLLSGEDVACWAFTEPATGSDPRAITTRAETVPEGWRIRGNKSFISHSSHATVAVVFAQLDGELTAFIGPTDVGFEPGPRERLLAFNGADTGPVALDGFVATHMLGPPGGGFDVLRRGEAEAKLRACAISLGICEDALAVAVDYARQRTHRDMPIGEKFQSTQWLLAECAAKTLTVRSLLDHAAREFDRGTASPGLAASAKLMCSRMAREVATDAVQVLGAYGASKDYRAEMLYRQAKVYELVQGVSEINRTIIANQLMRLGRRA
jgi:alkylation response protein AidB-like acyl-CoA dehydrogenase